MHIQKKQPNIFEEKISRKHKQNNQIAIERLQLMQYLVEMITVNKLFSVLSKYGFMKVAAVRTEKLKQAKMNINLKMKMLEM